MIDGKRLRLGARLLAVMAIAISCVSGALAVSAQAMTMEHRDKVIQEQIVIADLNGNYKNLCGNASGVGIDPATQELAGCNDRKKTGGVVAAVMRMVYLILGIVAVIFLIYGGFLYIYSAGDPGKVKKAKDTIIYAILGIVVAVLAAAIINFVIISVRGGA